MSCKENDQNGNNYINYITINNYGGSHIEKKATLERGLKKVTGGRKFLV